MVARSHAGAAAGAVQTGRGEGAGAGVSAGLPRRGLLQVARHPQEVRSCARRQVREVEAALQGLFPVQACEIFGEHAAAEAEPAELALCGGAILDQAQVAVLRVATDGAVGLMHGVPVAFQRLQYPSFMDVDDAGETEAGVQDSGFGVDVGEGRPQAFGAAMGDAALIDEAVQAGGGCGVGRASRGLGQARLRETAQHPDVACVVAIELHAKAFEGIGNRTQGARVGVHRSANALQSLDGLQAKP